MNYKLTRSKHMIEVSSIAYLNQNDRRDTSQTDPVSTIIENLL